VDGFGGRGERAVVVVMVVVVKKIMDATYRNT